MSDERAFVLLLLAVNGLVLHLLERRIPQSSASAAERWRHVAPNLALTGLLFALNLGFDAALGAAGVLPRGGASGLLGRAKLPEWAGVLLVVVVLDGLAYLAHVSMHKLAPAWRFHRIHHSDAHVDVTTAFRQHPLETLWRYSFLFAGVLLLGASSRSVAVYLALSALNAQLEHAHVTLPPRIDGALRLLLATPAMHRVHHSRRQAETDTNYSNILSVWDRVFGTYRAPHPGEAIDCGLDEIDAPAQQRTSGLLALPFGR
jgi:sterol desaturase/sphingolipid hydroxylase (fatty acid hydroxylase superfamily)